MGRESESPKVVRHSSLTEYFRHEVHAAVCATSVEARSETVSYLADLMARFARGHAASHAARSRCRTSTRCNALYDLRRRFVLASLPLPVDQRRWRSLD